MAKIPVADRMHEQRVSQSREAHEGGPFVTISRQYGCHGFSLGLLLLEILNDRADTHEEIWKIYHKEILDRLATETHLAADILERQRRGKPSLFEDFFRSLSGEKIPSGYEVRNRITEIIRGLACQGRAVIIGQGGAGATGDMPNGLSVRLEAPEDWRVKQVVLDEGISETEARLRIQAKEKEREYLRSIYESRFPRKPAFHLTYDCSAFTLAQIAQHVVHAMKLKKMT